jgi:three-Cys-motif partner protein
LTLPSLEVVVLRDFVLDFLSRFDHCSINVRKWGVGMSTQRFGSDHTNRKLETVQKYLSAYTTALKKQNFQLIYFDACAGSGSSAPKAEDSQAALLEVDEITVGSAVRALGVEPAFDRYIFNDLKRNNVRSLKAIVESDFSQLKDRVQLTQKDANEALIELCDSVNWKSSRAVVFLDPFGLQIKFATLEKLAQTKAVDVWYLVPVHAMSRQVKGDGTVLDDGGRSVDEALGYRGWREVVQVVEEAQADMFGHSKTETSKAVDAAWFEGCAYKRLSSIFEGGVLRETLPLGRNNLHDFSLMFAWANPSGPAKLAAKLAKAVLK